MGTPSYFLGMTKLGNPNLFSCSSRRQRRCVSVEPPRRKAIAGVPSDKFLEAFEKWASKTQSHTVRQVLIPQIFEQVLERQLDYREMELLLKYFDIANEGHLTRGEFLTRFKRFRDEEHPVVQRAERPKTPGEDHVTFGRYSYVQLQDLRGKHTRSDFGPIDVQNYPLTTNQKYGWHDESKIIQKVYVPRKSTEVTRNEGICLTNYYIS